MNSCDISFTLWQERKRNGRGKRGKVWRREIVVEEEGTVVTVVEKGQWFSERCDQLCWSLNESTDPSTASECLRQQTEWCYWCGCSALCVQYFLSPNPEQEGEREKERKEERGKRGWEKRKESAASGDIVTAVASNWHSVSGEIWPILNGIRGKEETWTLCIALGTKEDSSVHPSASAAGQTRPGLRPMDGRALLSSTFLFTHSGNQVDPAAAAWAYFSHFSTGTGASDPLWTVMHLALCTLYFAPLPKYTLFFVTHSTSSHSLNSPFRTTLNWLWRLILRDGTFKQTFSSVQNKLPLPGKCRLDLYGSLFCRVVCMCVCRLTTQTQLTRRQGAILCEKKLYCTCNFSPK